MALDLAGADALARRAVARGFPGACGNDAGDGLVRPGRFLEAQETSGNRRFDLPEGWGIPWYAVPQDSGGQLMLFDFPSCGCAVIRIAP